MNTKVLQKMHEKGLITAQELEDGVISEERYDLFIAGVDLIDGVVKTANGQLQAYTALIDDARHDQTYVKSQIRKIEKLKKKKGYGADDSGAFGVGVVKMRERKEKTQKAEIIRHIREEGSVTSWEAFMEYGITRLSAIIYVLRHDEGMSIDTSTVTKRNRYGNIVNFAKYTLNENANK